MYEVEHIFGTSEIEPVTSRSKEAMTQNKFTQIIGNTQLKMSITTASHRIFITRRLLNSTFN